MKTIPLLRPLLYIRFMPEGNWNNLKTLDNLLYTYYLVGFFITSLILLVVMIMIVEW